MFGSTPKEPERDDPADALVREVGVQLRQARMARGEKLEEVAAHLRIRPTYLYGLEQGDLSVMPGRTYALGFLRSYAQYLGFDGDDLIAQIRSSVADLTGGAPLHERTPLSENRLPKLPLVVVSLAALAGIYAGWAYVGDRSGEPVELVAEVPAELQEQAAAPPDLRPTIAPAAQPTVQPAISTAAPQAGSSEAPEPAAGEQTSPEVTATPAASQAAPAEPEEPAGGQSVTEASNGSAAAVLAALPPVAAAGAAPTVYRSDDAAARVILRARDSAWVHVSSTNNDYLWVKTLQPGDAFVVPDRPDLVLWTGNAGGIEVIVDGAPLPPLGPEAGVLRDVSLQPEALLRRLQPEPAADAAASP